MLTRRKFICSTIWSPTTVLQVGLGPRMVIAQQLVLQLRQGPAELEHNCTTNRITPRRVRAQQYFTFDKVRIGPSGVRPTQYYLLLRIGPCRVRAQVQQYYSQDSAPQGQSKTLLEVGQLSLILEVDLKLFFYTYLNK